jgi:hypothetical protein
MPGCGPSRPSTTARSAIAGPLAERDDGLTGRGTVAGQRQFVAVEFNDDGTLAHGPSISSRWPPCTRKRPPNGASVASIWAE